MNRTPPPDPDAASARVTTVPPATQPPALGPKGTPSSTRSPGPLARLQQGTTLGALALAALWAWGFARAGLPRWALAGALLIVCGYAFVLALEFVLLRVAHGAAADDPAPRATPLQLARAWWGEVCSAPLVFCWRQPFFSRREPDFLPALPAPPGEHEVPGRRGVLLIHGFVCNRGLWNPWLARLRRRGVPVVAVNLEPVFGSIDEYAACIEAGYRRLVEATGLAPVVVAHSMGGLALRAWWAGRGNDAALVHRAITIGTPHHGTWLARFAFSRNARQMRRGSRWLQALAAREPAGHGARYTCFYGHCDNIVFPPATAMLEGADNRHLAAVAHVHMAERPEAWEEAMRWVDGAQPSVTLRPPTAW